MTYLSYESFYHFGWFHWYIVATLLTCLCVCLCVLKSMYRPHIYHRLELCHNSSGSYTETTCYKKEWSVWLTQVFNALPWSENISYTPIHVTKRHKKRKLNIPYMHLTLGGPSYRKASGANPPMKAIHQSRHRVWGLTHRRAIKEETIAI